jgi:hypothetical protein
MKQSDRFELSSVEVVQAVAEWLLKKGLIAENHGQVKLVEPEVKELVFDVPK